MKFEFMQDRSLEIDRLVMIGLMAEILYNITDLIAYRWFAIFVCTISLIILLLFLISMIYGAIKE